MKRVSFTIAIAMFAAILPGCNLSKVHYDNTVRLEPGRPVTLELDAPKKTQVVNIEVSAGETIDVEVVLDKDRGKSKPLMRKSDIKSTSGNVEIPAGERFSITLTLRSPKGTEVSVKANSVE